MSVQPAELSCEIGSGPRITGPRTRPRTHVLAPGSTVVGLWLRPAAAAVLRVPPAELLDAELDAGLVLGRRAVAPFRGDSAPQALASLRRLVTDRAADVPDPLVATVVQRLTSGPVRVRPHQQGHQHVRVIPGRPAPPVRRCARNPEVSSRRTASITSHTGCDAGSHRYRARSLETGRTSRSRSA